MVDRPNDEAVETDVMREKARRGIPPIAGNALRSWIRYQLQQRTNAATGKPYSQRAIAEETFTSEGTVSFVCRGDRVKGRRNERVRRRIAEVLNIPEAILFPALAGGDVLPAGGKQDDGSG